MGKKKQSKSVSVILLAAGIVFICASLYISFCNIRYYVKQFDQKDWKITTATVINVERHSSSRRYRNNYYYDIYYQYEAEENIYNGVIYRINASRKIGETFDIKYDPEAPQDSTHYLEPTFGIVVSGIIGFIIFGGIGIRMVQISLPKKKKSRHRNRRKKIE